MLQSQYEEASLETQRRFPVFRTTRFWNDLLMETEWKKSSSQALTGCKRKLKIHQRDNTVPAKARGWNQWPERSQQVEWYKPGSNLFCKRSFTTL